MLKLYIQKHIKSRLTIISIISIFICSCASFTTKRPTLQDLKGTWVSTGQVYYQLTFNDKEDSYLVAVFNEKLVKKYKLEIFETLENNFNASFIDKKDSEKSVKIKGSLIASRLILEGASKKDEKIWFIKSSDIVAYKKIANEIIKEKTF